MTDKRLRFGIIGFGKIGPRHKAVIDKNPNCELIGVCDIDPKRLKFARSFDPLSYENYKSMLRHNNIDVISVCTPNYLHAQMTIDALYSGKHVICEKPMALTFSDCQSMTEAAQKNHRNLFVVMQNRYNPPVKQVKDLLNQTKLGKVYYAALNCFWNRTQEYYESPWKGNKEKDGGCLFTQFNHFLDIMYWFMGDVRSVLARSANLGHREIEIEDTGSIVVEFVSGALGAINFTTCAYGKNMEGSITLFGQNGTVKIGGQYLNTIEYRNVKNCEAIDIPQICKGESLRYGFYEGSMSNHHKVYENVVDVLLNGKEIDFSPNEATEVIHFTNSIYKAMEETRK